MSTITQVTNTSNNLVVNYNTQKVALGDNEFIKGTYTAAGAITIAEGTVFGRISATGKIAILDKDATNDSAYPVGVFFNGIGGSKVISGAGDFELTLINKGSVDAGMLVFAAGTTVDSVVGVKRITDHLNDLGLVLETSTELTKVDNQ